VAARPLRREGAPLVTLSSDLGAAYAAQLKAVLAHRLPPGHIVDLAHDLRPHDVAEAAFVVRAMAERFPAGSVHVVVVDPGVGGPRAPVVIDCRDGSRLVGPDNGVLVPLMEALGGGTAYRIDPTRTGARPRVGTTFDGRDVFAPAAARLVEGARPRDLGPTTALVRLGPRSPRRGAGSAEGSVAHVDRFGNLVTNVPSAWVPAGTRQLAVRVGRRRLRLAFVASYEAGGADAPLALASSFGTLEIAVRLGRAADRLRVGVGAAVRFQWWTPRARAGRLNRK